MFNFSANNLIFVSKSQYDKCNILIMKVNSADKIYLVLEMIKEDKKNVLKP
ncbi:MAG TPA: hypothetical protein PK733_07180 [Clostridiales bacterium]|nr:hypothetical protein [Clostridiales bacterium]